MNTEKIGRVAKDLRPLLWVVVVVVVLIVFKKQISAMFNGLRNVLGSFGSSDNLDKDKNSANNQISIMNKTAIVPTAKDESDANTIHRLLDTYYGLDFLTHIASQSEISNDDAVKVFQTLVNKKTGLAVAATIKAYGARKLPNRTGSLSGIFYDDSYGTLRDHVSRYFPDGSTKTTTLAYIDKVSSDYF